ncbi:MAG: dienelactone hydrolase family protein [Polyangiaceae bacterium]
MTGTAAPAFLFAPGAGAPSASAWMVAFRRRLEQLGTVHGFDYAYQVARRRTPDRLPALISAHRAAFDALASEHAGPIVLIGKSMGGRIGCHLANELESERLRALVCLGYPLIGQNGAVRDAVLLELKKPILFVQGTRDDMCPLERLAEVEARMQSPHQRYVVDGGDHSLLVLKGELARSGRTQDGVDAAILERIATFVSSLR